MTMLTDRAVRQIGVEILAAVKKIAAVYGLEADSAGGSVGHGTATLKFALNDPSVMKEKLADAGINGNAVFSFRGRQYKVVDIIHSRPRFPVLAQRLPDGKRFKFPMYVLEHGNAK